MHFDNKVVVRTDMPTWEWHPTLLWPNGWMDEDATWYGSRSLCRPHCIRRRVPSTQRKAHSTLLSFRPMSIVATVAHLSYCWALVQWSVNNWTFHITGRCTYEFNIFRSLTCCPFIAMYFWMMAVIDHSSRYNISHWLFMSSSYMQHSVHNVRP